MCENSQDKIIKNIESTIYTVTHNYKGGARGLAADLGLKSAGTFNNKCDPNMPDHKINIHEFIKIISKTKDHTILFDLAHNFGYACFPLNSNLKNVSDIELLNAWAEWDSERGETAKSIKEALTDGDINQNEIKKIKEEMLDDIQKELELFKRLESISTNSYEK